MTIPAFVRFVRRCLLLSFLLVPFLTRAAGTWVPVTNTAPNGFGVQPIFILPDGTVMCGTGGNTAWYRLTPDTHGSYLNGSWSTMAPMHYTRRFMSSQVLPSSGGQLYVAGGEYGTGKDNAEIYNITNNTWTVLPTPPDEIIDNISETMPNGDVLEGSPTDDSRIFYVSSNLWSAPIKPNDGQDEASWVKLQDGSIITIDPFGTNVERFIPSLNKWVTDTPVPVPMYGYDGELGGGLLLPTGQAIFFGGSGSNCVYTPWTTNYAGIYTPNGATNAGTWTTVASTPNFNAPIDAPAAMMVNGNILCCMTPTNNSYGPSYCTFYEYNPVSNVFTEINGPTGTSTFGTSCEGITFLAIPDGSILMSSGSGQLYEYQPSGSPLTNGIPAILAASTNADGSFHLTGTLFNGITEGGVFGDDTQVSSDYPVARFTNATGNTLYARTFNWSTCNLMTGTNVVSCDMALPAGMTAGTFPVVMTANGIASAPFNLSIIGTPLPTVAGLAFSSISSNQMSFYWDKINISETGYFIQRSTDAVNFATIGAVSSTVTNYTDNTGVTPLGEYYYRVLGTNGTGLTGLPCAPILAASPGVYPVPAPWTSQDVGPVIGAGTAATNGGTYTLIGSGNGIGSDNDQCQFVWQPIAGDFTLTARLTASQNTGTNVLAGVMLRNSTGNDVASAMMGYNPVLQVPVFEHRVDAAGVAGYGLKYLTETDGDGLGGGDSPGVAISSFGADQISAPVWLRLVRAGNSITGYSSLDGTNWTLAGTATCDLAAVADIGLAVTSGTYDLLNLSTFDNVTVTGTPALVPPPMAEWKLDETSGITAEDYIDGFDGSYLNVTLGLPGATPDTGTAAGFNGTNANILLPPLNLNSNVATITTWMYRTVNEPAACGVFFNRANSTVSGLNFYNSTANELGYTWNAVSGTYNWQSGLIVPSNTWTFVALVISPTNAIMYMGTNNGALLSATNNVANAVQAFDGSSYIGQDTYSSSRYFIGQLDQVQFFNRTLNATQLASFVSAPVISLTAPTNGLALTVPASFNLAAALSATNGHTINLVQLFTNGTMLAEYPAPPYTNALSALPAGVYSVSARLFYDSSLEVDSDVANVFVENFAGTPTNLVATAVSSNLVNVTWSAGTNAMGYILSRGGSPIATLAGTSYADYGLSGGVNYCYTIVATNLASTSAASPSSCVTTPTAGDTLVWNATRSPAGPQDGSGFWGGATTNWWNGSANVAWADGNVAFFGVNAATNFTVTITNSVTPSGLVFGGAGPGACTLTGSTNYSILTTSNLTFTVDGNATILSPLFGTNNLIKNGSGTLTLSNASPSYVGTVTINDGALVMSTGPSSVDVGYIIGTNGALYQGYTTDPGNYTKGIVIYGAGLNSSNGLHLACGTSLEEETFSLSNAPTLITSYGSGVNAQMESFDINYDSLVVNSAASGSVIDSTVNINVSAGYGFRINASSGANTATGDLVINGLVVGTGNELRKYGTGSLRLSGTNTYDTGTLVAAGSLQLAGPNSPLGTGIVNYSASGTLQAIVSSYLPNGFSINSGDTLTIDTLTNELTIAGAITNLGKIYKISPGILALAGVNTYTNTTVIGAGTLQVDGVMGATAITISNNATLAGTGVLTATPTLQSGSYFAPGDSGVGTLTVSNNLTLNAGSKTIMQVGDYSGVTSNDQAFVTGTLAYAGSLIVSNVGTSALAGGDTFQLFNAAAHSGGFTNVTLPALATGLLWNTNSLISAGTISVGYVQETLTYNAGAHGAISGTTPQTVNYGFNGTAVTAVPNTGYHFVNWSDSSVANPRTDTGVTNNITVTANFAINTYTLTYTAGTNGTLSGTSPQTVNYGANGTAVTAVANSGYSFVNWSDGSLANPRTDTGVTNNITVTANFATSTFTLTYSAGANGTISGTSPQTVGYGAAGTAVTALPNSGFGFTNWSDGKTADPRTDSNVTNNLTVTANFVSTTNGPLAWNGGGAAGNWSAAGNWNWALPANGQALTFQGTQELSNSNDLLTAVGQVVFNAGGFALTGNPVTLQGGLLNVTGTNVWGLNATLGSAQSLVSSNGTLTISGAVTNAGYTLTVSGPASNVVSGAVSGSGGLVMNGPGTLTLAANQPLTGGITVNSGTVAVTTDNFGGQFTPSLVTVNAGGTLWNDNYHALGYETAVFVNQGVWLMSYEDYKTGVTMVDGQINNGPGGDSGGLRLGYFTTSVITVTNSAVGSVINVGVNDVSGNNLLNVSRGAAASDLTVNGIISNAGGLVLNGNGITTFTAANSYTGPTTVSNGTLVVNGSLGTNTLTVDGTLEGDGVINGATTIASGGALTAGTSAGLGTLTVSNTLTVNAGAAVSLRLSKTGGVLTNDSLAGLTAVTYGGTLTVTNVTSDSTALAAGDSFQLFGAASYAGGFTGVTLPALATGLVWNTNNLTVNGTISVGYIQETLTYNAGANGTLSGTSPQTVNYGASGTAVTPVPNTGYHFVNWSDGSVANPRTDTGVTNNITVTANFAINTYTLTYTAGTNGTLSGTSPQTVNYGASGTAVTPVPNTGYHFVNWSDGSVANPRTDTGVTNNITVTANFAINTYTLTYTAGANGSLSGTTPQTVNYGANGTAVTAVAGGGYAFTNWSDGSTANPRTDTDVTNNISVTANFVASSFTLTYTAGTNGSLSGTSPQTVGYGANGTAVTALPNSGYAFTNWSDGSTADPRTDTGVTSNITVTANFVSITNGPLVWNGGGSDGNWSTAGNWNWALPASGQSLTFAGTVQPANTNDFLTVVGQLTFDNGGFALAGQAVTLQGNLLNLAGANNLSLGTTLGAAASFVSSNGILTVSGAVTNAGYTLTLDGPSSNVVSGVISGSGPLVKNGTGTAVLSGASTFTNAVTVNAGTLQVTAKSGDVVYTVAQGATLQIGYSTGSGYANTAMTINGNGAAATTGFYLAGGKNYNSSGKITLQTAPTTLRQYGTGLANLGTFDINGVGLHCAAAASGSVLDPNIQLVSDGYGMTIQADAGTNTATGDVIVNGPLSVGSLGFYKEGTGTLVLNGQATTGNTAVQVKAGTLICGVTNCLGVNASVPVSSGALLELSGLNETIGSLNGAAGSTIDFGGTGTLTVSNPPVLAGTVDMVLNPGTVTGSALVLESGTLTNGGSLVITTTGTNALAAGDSFLLFNAPAYAGGFTNITLPSLPTGLVWNNNINANGTLSVGYVQETLTYTAGANGALSGTSPQTVNYGFNGTAVTAVPNTGYHFVNWSDGSTANPRTDTGVTNNITVTANFAINTYTLTYTAGTNGTLSGTSPQTVNYGASGTAVTPVPNTGYHFVNWSDGSVANPRTDTGVTNNITVTANFAINTYTLTYTAGTNGTLSGTSPQTVNYGASGTAVTPVPNTGYHFVNWSDGSVANPRTDTGVTNNITVTANFAINTYTLTYTAGTNGTLSGTSPQTVNYGASGTAVTPVPNTGYHFVNWSDGSVANPRTDTGVTNNITVTANFAINTYTLTYTAGTNGTLSGTSPQTVNYGASGTAVTAVPNSGYAFTNWSDGLTANPRTDTGVTNNVTVTANFIASGTGYATLLLAQSPATYWRLDETNGAASLADASGNGHAATSQGTGLVLGVAGPQSPAYPLFETTNTAAQFNGASNYISGGTAASLGGTNDFTLSAWVKTTATTTGVILQQRDPSSSGYVGEYQLSVNPAGTVSFYIYGSGGYQYNFGTTRAVNDGQWHTVMAERSGGTNGYIYIDGVLAAATNGAVQSLSSAITNYIGRDVRNLDNTFNGQIDEVAIFTRALTTNQIAQLSNTNAYLLPSLWSSNAVGTVATETTATYFSKAFAVGGAGAGIATNADSFTFVSLPLTNSLTITAEVMSLQTNGTAPLAGVMVRSSTNTGSVFAFLGLTATNSAKWIYRSTSNAVSSSSTFTNLPLPYWVRIIRSTNTFTGLVSSNGSAWVQAASVTLTNLATNALVGLVTSSGVSNVLDAAVYDSVTVTNGGVLVYQPQFLPTPPPPAYAELDSFTVSYGTASFTINGDENSTWQIEESNDLVNWTPVETVTLIGGSVSQTQSDAPSPARYYRLVQVR